MSLFYFDISNGTREPDLAGSECESVDRARVAAVRFAGELLRDNGDAVWEGHDLRVEVSDAKHMPLFAIVTSAMSLYPTP